MIFIRVRRPGLGSITLKVEDEHLWEVIDRAAREFGNSPSGSTSQVGYSVPMAPTVTGRRKRAR